MFIKRLLLFILVSAIFVSMVISAVAHAGKTDGVGGHIESDTGEYHYHHGYPAHSHYDMDGDGDVDCPYNFNDQTGSNSGGPSSGKSNYSNSFDNVIVTTETVTKTVTKEVPYIPNWIYWIFAGAGSLIVFLFLKLYYKEKEIDEIKSTHSALIDTVHSKHKKAIERLNDSFDGERKTMASKIEFLQDQQFRLTSSIAHLNQVIFEERKKLQLARAFLARNSQCCNGDDDHLVFQALLEGDSAIPKEVYLLDDLTPVCGTVSPNAPYGDFTVYVSRSGHCFHTTRYCGYGSYYPCHVYEAMKDLPQCRKCASSKFKEIPEWYILLKKL